MLRRLGAVVAIVGAVSGCVHASSMRDTQTIHNADATRIWIVQGVLDNQYVVMCDVGMHVQTQKLCVRWPPPAAAP